MVQLWNHQAGQKVISKGPLCLCLLCQILLHDPQLCEVTWVLLFDHICKSLERFYVKLKKIQLKSATYARCQELSAGQVCSAPCHPVSSKERARTFCCCHDLHLQPANNSTESCLTSGSFPGKQIRDALRVINRDCQRLRWGWCLGLFALSRASSLGPVEEWRNKQKNYLAAGVILV